MQYSESLINVLETLLCKGVIGLRGGGAKPS